jgi:hypothetical protein
MAYAIRKTINAILGSISTANIERRGEIRVHVLIVLRMCVSICS